MQICDVYVAVVVVSTERQDITIRRDDTTYQLDDLTDDTTKRLGGTTKDEQRRQVRPFPRMYFCPSC